jgi:asparagine synthase (glutamine-hydrolysing)
MCGIAGYIDYRQKTSKETLVKMTDAMLHRGPDDAGYEIFDVGNAAIGIGQRRLSIIDLSPLGHQPMHSQNDRWSIVFNGEIYNYQEIQKELRSRGYSFKSNSDTEVILNAFDCWGVGAVNRFVGMFAFVLFDKTAQQVYCFRDRAGVKPFYYYWKDGLFLFASELKAFHQHPDFQKQINQQSLAEFLSFGYIGTPNCIFEASHKLPPGHYLQFDIQRSTYDVHCYWNVYDCYNQPTLQIDEQEAITETQKILQSACDYRMVADVPVGVFLSGGYDSSTVAALLQHSRTEKIKTFTIGFHEQNYNEAVYAKQIAQHLGTDHTEYYCTQEDAAAIIPTLAHFYDEPFGDSSAIPTVLVSQVARKQVTVALSADAGDEVFAGYTKYEVILEYQRKLSLMPKNIRSGIANIMDNFVADDIPFFRNTYNANTRYDKIINLLKNENAFDLLYGTSLSMTNSQINSILLNKSESTNYWNKPWITKNLHNKDALSILQAIDYKTYLIDDILTKVDRATMSVSLEGREPFLDHRLIEWVAQLPSNLKYRNGIKKYLLRQITHQYLPKTLMDRPKMGFGIPVVEWLRKDLKMYFDDYFDKNFIEQQGIFDVEAVTNIVKRYQDGKGVNINTIWFLLMFQMWYKRWM